MSIIYTKTVRVEDGPRVKIITASSNYLDKLGYIMFSNCDGTFHVKVQTEGNPEIDLEPDQIEPC